MSTQTSETGSLPTEFTSLIPHDGVELREGYADVGDDVTLHYVEAGEGPMVVLLHGFPEFWFGWRLQIAPLAAAGFRVVAPDTRGYNLSSKPSGVDAYAGGKLADDIRGLIRALGAESAMLVGHDWGGTIRGSFSRDCNTRVSSGSPGTTSSSRCPDCPRRWFTPETGTSSSTFCTTRARRTRRRRWSATSRRGRSRVRQPG